MIKRANPEIAKSISNWYDSSADKGGTMKGIVWDVLWMLKNSDFCLDWPDRVKNSVIWLFQLLWLYANVLGLAMHSTTVGMLLVTIPTCFWVLPFGLRAQTRTRVYGRRDRRIPENNHNEWRIAIAFSTGGLMAATIIGGYLTEVSVPSCMARVAVMILCAGATIVFAPDLNSEDS